MSDPKNLQAKLFGERFRGAELGRVGLPPDSYVHANNWIANPKNFMVVVGPPGTGKTYFCAAMLPHLIKIFTSVRVWNERDILQRLRGNISEAKSGDYLYHLQQFVDDQLVIVDDVGASGRNDWREEILIELVDFRYRLNLPTIFTSNLMKSDFFRDYNSRIGSRLFSSQNVIVDMTGMPDQRQLGN